MMRFIGVIIIFVAVFMLSNCKPNKSVESSEVDAEVYDTTTWNVSDVDLNKLLLPPAELMIFIHDLDLNPKLTNNVDRIGAYNTTKSKCVNLGIYMADMVYLGLLNEKNKMPRYAHAVKQLSNDLRIYRVMDDQLIERLAKHINIQDSVYALSRTLQDNFISTLDLTNRQNILAMISMGIFIESLYLIINNLEKYEDFNEINIEMLNQKKIFDEYYDYTSNFLDDPKVSRLIVEIEPLKMFYKKLTSEENQKEIKEDSLQHYTISSGNSLILTEEGFEELKSTVEIVRVQLTHN